MVVQRGAANVGCADGDRGDRGFSLIEQIIAIVVIAGVLLGLLSTLGATAAGVNTGRQRTIAVSLAKQVIENLQGVAYSDVAVNQATLTADPLLTGVLPNLMFEGEQLILGGPTAATFHTPTVAVGTTYSLRTFVTAVSSTTGAGYRRTTVIIDWPSGSPRHTLRFSSMVFPLDYTSYPVSRGSAESTGGLITVTGDLGGDTFENVHVVLPGVRAETSSSTLRTSIGAAASATSFVDLLAGPVMSTNCTAIGDDRGECARQTNESIADNDSTSSSTGGWAANVGQAFVAGNLSTPGGATIVTPAGAMTSRASTDVCGPCAFGDNDDSPWVDASVATTTATWATFASYHGGDVLSGSLWSLDSAWSPSASVDHDPAGGGTVLASAQLAAPALRVLQVGGAPAGYDGAVKVSAFTATSSVQSGYTMAPPDVATGTTSVQLQLWDGVAYRAVSIPPGTALDTTATASFTIGTNIVTFVTRVQAQSSTFSTIATAPRTDAAAQHPSILVITVEVTVSTLPPPIPEPTTTSTIAESTTTTIAETTTIPATTTTIAPIPVVTDHFTIVVDYGRVSAHGTWLEKAA